MQDRCNLLRTLDHWIAGTLDVTAVKSAIDRWATSERRSTTADDGSPDNEPLRQEIFRRGLPVAIADRLSRSPRPVEAVLELFAKLGDEYLTQSIPSKQPPSVWDDHGVSLSGETLGDGRYALYEPPVQSGQAEIWKAIDNRSIIASSSSGHEYGTAPNRFRVVALKRPHPDDLRSASRAKAAKASLLKEARRAALLEHPNICPVYFIHEGAEDESPFYTLRFLKDATLAEEIRKVYCDSQPKHPTEADLRRLVGFLAEAAAGVAYAHKQGFVHLDLKPSNIAVDNVNGTQVFDWGQASSITAGVASDGRADLGVSIASPEATQIVLSTPAYASPEQILRRPCSTRTDVFQLGAILYEILSSVPPYLDISSEVTLVRSALGTPASLGNTKELPHLRSHRLRLLVAICRHAMQPDPIRRYDTIDRFREDLLHWLNDEAISVAPESRLQQLRRVYRKNRRSFRVGFGILIASVFLAVGYGTWNYFAYHHVYTEVYRQVVFGPDGPRGVRLLSRTTLARVTVAYQASRRGWNGPIHRIQAVNALCYPSIVSEIQPLLSTSQNLLIGESANCVDYTYHNGCISEERAYALEGYPLWWIQYDFHNDVEGLTATFKRVSARHVSPKSVTQEKRSFYGATSVMITWNSARLFEELRYLDANGDSAKGNRGEYGVRLARGDDGLPLRMVFLDQSGLPVPRSDGIAQIDVGRDPSTGMELEFCQRDQAGKLTISDEGFSVGLLRWNSLGLLQGISFFDQSRMPCQPIGDVASIQIQYNSDNCIESISFFDVTNNRARLASDGPTNASFTYRDGRLRSRVTSGYDFTKLGIAGQEEIFNQDNRVVAGRLLDSDGNTAKESAVGFVSWKSDFYSDGTERKREFFDNIGRPAHCDGEHTGYEAFYITGRLHKMRFFGHDIETWGFDVQENIYNEFEQVSEVRFFGRDGQRAVSSADGVWGWNSVFIDGLEASRTYLDVTNVTVPVKVIIQEVIAGGQGQKAGLLKGDQIISYNGTQVLSRFELVHATGSISTKHREIPLVIRRGAETISIMVNPGRIGVILHDQNTK